MAEARSSNRHAGGRWAAWAIAVGVVLSVFPDVVFFGASFQNSQVVRVFDPRPAPRALIPETERRTLADGYRDLGSAAWQLEPAQRFMRRCLVEGQSPYWNPYSACGTHGPERLVSVSFSALTVATAVLGAGTRALHAVLLIAFVLALYCLYRALTIFFGRSPVAAVAACFAFLLVGFHISMLGAQMVHAYILAPILLRALLALVAAPTARRFLGATLASALLLAETFVPTTMLILICVHALCLAYGVRRWHDPLRDAARQLAAQAGASVAGMLLLAPLVFPIVESLPLSEWSERPFGTAGPHAALSVATPKHFWESYGAFRRSRDFNDADLFVNRVEATRVFHLGVAALLLAVQAFAARRGRRDPLVVICGLLMAISLGRLFGVFPFTWIEHLPILSLISDQYWGALLCFPFCILLAYGVDALSPATVWRWPTLAVLGYLGACYFFLLGRVGFPDSGPALLNVRVLGALVAAVVVAFAVLRLRPGWRRGVAAFLVLLVAGELIFYMNRLRPERRELESSEIKLVEFLRTHLNRERVLNVGNRGLYPNWGSAFGIPQIDSLDGVNLASYAAFFDRRIGRTDQFLAIRGPQGDRVKINRAALDLLGVRYVVVSHSMRRHRRFFLRHRFAEVFRKRGLWIFENPTVYPRAFVVGGLVRASGIPADLRMSGRDVALTTDDELLARAGEIGIPDSAREESKSNTGVVEIVEYRHARVELDAALERPGVVVLSDTWHPSWRAAVDGEPVHLGRVDEVLRGVALPAGQHRVVMTYSPRSLPLAWVVSFLTAAGLGWWVWAGRSGHQPASQSM